jgi:hypothetical protein
MNSTTPETKTHRIDDRAAGQEYRFERLTTGLAMHDMYYPSDAPRPGDEIPDFDMPTTDGGRFSRGDLAENAATLLVFGSYSCPVELRLPLGHKGHDLVPGSLGRCEESSATSTPFSRPPGPRSRRDHSDRIGHRRSVGLIPSLAASPDPTAYKAKVYPSVRHERSVECLGSPLTPDVQAVG